jgi:glycosyltransferase involved in cell wall biosynthesis
VRELILPQSDASLESVRRVLARPDVCVVVPAFNEGTALAGVLAALACLPYRVIVVDDGSADDTSTQASRFDLCLLRHIWNLGQGAALATGIAYALRLPETRYVVTFDADGQHTAADVSRMIAALEAEELDVVLGTRFGVEASPRGIPFVRRLTLRLGTAFTRLTTGLHLTDTHNGMRAFTALAAGRITITQNRMAHASEILSRIAELGLKYREVPVTVRYTGYSTAKGQKSLDAVTILWDIATSRMR